MALRLPCLFVTRSQLACQTFTHCPRGGCTATEPDFCRKITRPGYRITAVTYVTNRNETQTLWQSVVMLTHGCFCPGGGVLQRRRQRRRRGAVSKPPKPASLVGVDQRRPLLPRSDNCHSEGKPPVVTVHLFIAFLPKPRPADLKESSLNTVCYRLCLQTREARRVPFALKCINRRSYRLISAVVLFRDYFLFFFLL